MKKPVTLDLNGLPWGSMKECLGDDIKKYAKNLDPTCNWESQPSPQREQLFRRLYKGTNINALFCSSSVQLCSSVVMPARATRTEEFHRSCMRYEGECQTEYVHSIAGEVVSCIGCGLLKSSLKLNSKLPLMCVCVCVSWQSGTCWGSPSD